MGFRLILLTATCPQTQYLGSQNSAGVGKTLQQFARYRLWFWFYVLDYLGGVLQQSPGGQVVFCSPQ